MIRSGVFPTVLESQNLVWFGSSGTPCGPRPNARIQLEANVFSSECGRFSDVFLRLCQKHSILKPGPGPLSPTYSYFLYVVKYKYLMSLEYLMSHEP